MKAFPFFGIGGSLLSILKPTYLAAADGTLREVDPGGIIAKLEPSWSKGFSKIVYHLHQFFFLPVLKRHFMNSLQDYVEIENLTSLSIMLMQIVIMLPYADMGK